MKQEIINILGTNNTTPAVFDQDLEVSAIYTYKGDVFCLNDGRDFEFNEVSTKGQADILGAIKSKRFKFDKSFQC